MTPQLSYDIVTKVVLTMPKTVGAKKQTGHAGMDALERKRIAYRGDVYLEF